ncbi:MAG TPA: PTS sugar transporter subunit IIA [Thermoanaerobaculia bacterium]|jgi:PTS system nitrogen regulatory IIA component
MNALFAGGLVDPKLAFPHLVSRTLDGVLAEIAALVAEAGVVRDAADLAERLRKRERDGCTGVGNGVAFPHCRLEGLTEVVVSVGLSHEGIDFGAPDGIPITVLFLLLSPREAAALHLQALARLTRLARTPGLVDELRHANSAQEIVRALREAEGAGASTAATA